MAGLRPFAPGEYIVNDDGSYSTERTVTVQDAYGDWVNVPSLWKDERGRTIDLAGNDDEIVGTLQMYELEGGKPFERFKDLESAEKAAVARSNDGGAFSGSSLLRPDQTTNPLSSILNFSQSMRPVSESVLSSLLGLVPKKEK